MGTAINHYSTRWRVSYDAEEFVQLKGMIFTADYYNSSVASNSCVTFAISMPTVGVITSARCRFSVESTNGALVELKEGATYTGGVAINAINMDRNSTNTDHLTIASNPTVTNEGTRLIASVMGSPSTPGKSGSPGFCV